MAPAGGLRTFVPGSLERWVRYISFFIIPSISMPLLPIALPAYGIEPDPFLQMHIQGLLLPDDCESS
jgi:hypothetical protein